MNKSVSKCILNEASVYYIQAILRYEEIICMKKKTFECVILPRWSMVQSLELS